MYVYFSIMFAVIMIANNVKPIEGSTGIILVLGAIGMVLCHIGMDIKEGINRIK